MQQAHRKQDGMGRRSDSISKRGPGYQLNIVGLRPLERSVGGAQSFPGWGEYARIKEANAELRSINHNIARPFSKDLHVIFETKIGKVLAWQMS